MCLRFAEYLDKSVSKNYEDTTIGNHLLLYPTVFDVKIPYKSKNGEVPKLDVSFNTKEELTKEWIAMGGNFQDALKLHPVSTAKLTQEQKKMKELGEILGNPMLSLPMLMIE